MRKRRLRRLPRRPHKGEGSATSPPGERVRSSRLGRRRQVDDVIGERSREGVVSVVSLVDPIRGKEALPPRQVSGYAQAGWGGGDRWMTSSARGVVGGAAGAKGVGGPSLYPLSQVSRSDCHGGWLAKKLLYRSFPTG